MAHGDWHNVESVTTIAAMIAAVGAALIAIRRWVVMPITRFVTRIVQHMDEHSLMYQIVCRELVPNGGGALIDKVNKIDIRTAHLDSSAP
jgi:hypothetical protein